MANELFNPTQLLAVLEDMAADIEQGYKDTLARNGHIASGSLVDSISTEVEVRGSHYLVWLDMRDYWRFVEQDTRPHWPPMQAILEWIRIKPVIPRPDDRGRIPTPKQLAFLIGRAMAGLSPNQAQLKNPRGGTTGTHDLEKTIDSVLAFYTDKLSEALAEDAERYITAWIP